MGNLKNKKQKGKLFDKTMIWCTVIIAAVTLCIVGAVVLPDPIIASVKLGEAEEFMGSASVEKISVTAPLEKDGVFEDKSYILSDAQAEEVAAELGELLDNSKYSKTYAISSSGVWKINIISYNADGQYKLYVDESAFYIESNGKLIRYIPVSDYAENYNEFYNKIIENFDE